MFKYNREGDLLDLIIKQILNFLKLVVASELGLDYAVCVLMRFSGFVK